MKESKHIKIQIGVIGSMDDIGPNWKVKELARELGKEIAKTDAILLFCLEEDFGSLSQIAAKEAIKFGGKTICFVRNSQKPRHTDSIRIITGQDRGGGREFSMIQSCDVIISIGGGSGTMMEIAMAYQAGIPIVALENSGGWSQKLAGTFLDDRKKQKITPSMNARDAVNKAMKLAKNHHHTL